ncbi:STAS/SEC14 domain-containing protein [candidate division WWE3 bacterium]|uniref:STAS/SEC14 domain-containing protein n=1 Tax=candidate division WWE3 bacterium TaxID=2053526 RepID=A0A955LW13_UNCKA|nr:STAS/SEC14 domain-containing protein [candidate division WWE3 bacterium]
MDSKKVIFNQDQGYIEEIWSGDITDEAVELMVNESIPYMNQLRRENRPVRVLINVEKLGATDSKARASAVKMLRSMDFDLMAVYGLGSVFQKHLVTLLVKAARMADRIQYHNSRESALEWLLHE